MNPIDSKIKKPVVSKSLCIGCGTCPALCGNTFAMNDAGLAYVINPSGDGEEDIQDAIDACPVDAISWQR